ncbi:hypothetical protein D1AOALGA4SA_4090 [Olavius algarvensis Delta 1 endosymbiont]|nr:hypothetical protein D1AOALGA4SA_4090 [Olavius algarvensis Delta 1 endosymbiont]
MVICYWYWKSDDRCQMTRLRSPSYAAAGRGQKQKGIGCKV